MNILDFLALVAAWAFTFPFIWNTPLLGLVIFPGAIALLASIGLIDYLKNTWIR